VCYLFFLWCSAWFLCQFFDYFHDGHMNIVYDDILKACFSKHSQWPPKSFRLRGAWELVLFYPSLDVWGNVYLNILCLFYTDLLYFFGQCWKIQYLYNIWNWVCKVDLVSQSCWCKLFIWLKMTNDDKSKACFSKHSQWPPKNFRLSPGLRVNVVISFLGCLRSNYSLVILLMCLVCFLLQLKHRMYVEWYELI